MSSEVSFYIPVFNGEKTINQCIDSILHQSIKVNDILVINDFSNDHTEEILKKYSEIKIINNEINKGLGYCRNLGVKSSQNKFIASIDADVVLDKFWLEILLNEIANNNIKICGGNMTEKLIENKYNLWRSKHYSQNWGDKDVLNPPFLYGCNTLQKRELWDKIGGYDENCTTNGEDVDYSGKARLIKNTNLYYSSKAKCYHLQNDNLESLSRRVWRYHSFGYKIKKPSLLKFFKLAIKQFKFCFKRIVSSILRFELKFLVIDLMVFIYFIKFEFLNTIKKIIK